MMTVAVMMICQTLHCAYVDQALHSSGLQAELSRGLFCVEQRSNMHIVYLVSMYLGRGAVRKISRC